MLSQLGGARGPAVAGAARCTPPGAWGRRLAHNAAPQQHRWQQQQQRGSHVCQVGAAGRGRIARARRRAERASPRGASSSVRSRCMLFVETRCRLSGTCGSSGVARSSEARISPARPAPKARRVAAAHSPARAARARPPLAREPAALTPCADALAHPQAHPRRVAKVASQIQREISEMFIYDDVRAGGCARRPVLRLRRSRARQQSLARRRGSPEARASPWRGRRSPRRLRRRSRSRPSSPTPSPACAAAAAAAPAPAAAAAPHVMQRAPAPAFLNRRPRRTRPRRRPQVMQRAICPERGQGDSLSAIAGVTHVYVSNDLQVCGDGSDAYGRGLLVYLCQVLARSARGQGCLWCRNKCAAADPEGRRRAGPRARRPGLAAALVRRLLLFPTRTQKRATPSLHKAHRAPPPPTGCQVLRVCLQRRARQGAGDGQPQAPRAVSKQRRGRTRGGGGRARLLGGWPAWAWRLQPRHRPRASGAGAAARAALPVHKRVLAHPKCTHSHAHIHTFTRTPHAHARPHRRYVRTQIGQRVRLRLTPEVRFEYDDSIEEEELVQQVGFRTVLNSNRV